MTPIDEPLVARGRIDGRNGRNAIVTATTIDADGPVRSITSEANGLLTSSPD